MTKENTCSPVAVERAKTGAATPQEVTTAANGAIRPGTANPQDTATPHAPSPFTDFAGLGAHLPMYKSRTLRELIKRRIIPSVRPPGIRKLNFHLPSVDAALLRYQRGGIE